MVGVTKAMKNMNNQIKMPQLQKIMQTWAGLKLEYQPFKATGVNILMQPGEVFEALDDNEVALQNMMGNRFMGFFEATITEWKGKASQQAAEFEVRLRKRGLTPNEKAVYLEEATCTL